MFYKVCVARGISYCHIYDFSDTTGAGQLPATRHSQPASFHLKSFTTAPLVTKPVEYTAAGLTSQASKQNIRTGKTSTAAYMPHDLKM